jgi:hypothetical protein
MITDEPSRYFESEQELYDYAIGQTETIGYLDTPETWVRLSKDELLVLGELHDQTTLRDLVQAVGTKRWLYEKYYELPSWIFAGYSKLAQVPAGRQGKLQELKAWREEGREHEAEAFMPKMWRILASFGVIESADRYLDQVGSTEWRLFQSLILAAAVAEGYEPKLYKAYNDHKDVLDAALSIPLDARYDWIKQKGYSAVKKSVEALQGTVAASVKSSMELDPKASPEQPASADLSSAEPAPGAAGPGKIYAEFSQGWHEAKKDYNDRLTVETDRARDFSMYLHILRAANVPAAGGYSLLYGFGRMHGERLQDLLAATKGRTQRPVRYLEMEEFIIEQRKRYPQ